MARKEPSMRRKKAAELAVANGGNISRALLDAGYPPATAKNPHKVTNSASWQELMEAYIPDDKLLRALDDDIEKKEGNRATELALAFKLKGKMVERTDITTLGQSINVMTEEEKSKLLSLLD